MSHQHSFGARRAHLSQAASWALDVGLRVRVRNQLEQRTIFSGADQLSLQQLAAELAELASRLRVRSFAVRAQLEDVTSALSLNVRCGFWPLARRAALDLAALLAHARKRRLADTELCLRGSNCALRIAELCGQEQR
jgi:hypothetical protein